MLGPSEGALSGSWWVSMKTPATPTATAARASTGTIRRSPPEDVPCPPGCCTEWVASKITGAPVAVVDANVRYPGLSQLAGVSRDRDDSVYATRWLRGSLALLTPPHAERAGEIVPQLARLLLDGVDLFAHVLCDLTGLELLGEHGSAAACMDATIMVARAHHTRESQLLALRRLMPVDRFLGVLLVG